jgi:hypothetical protein
MVGSRAGPGRIDVCSRTPPMVAIAVFTNPRGERCDAVGVDIERFDDPFAELLADVDAQRAGEILRRLVRDRSPR